MSFIDKAKESIAEAREALAEFIRVDEDKEGINNFTPQSGTGGLTRPVLSGTSVGDFPWELIYPFLHRNKTVCRGILGRCVATQGSGPYTEESFDLFLRKCGIAVRNVAGDPPPDVVVLGREGWNPDDLDHLRETYELGIRVYSQEMVIASMALGMDVIEVMDDVPTFIEFTAGHPALEYFDEYEEPNGDSFVEPDDGPFETLSVAFDFDSERPTIGILGDMGYHVGKVKGLPRDKRREILWRTFRVQLTATSPWTEEYIREWGQRCSPARLNKMCNVLRRLIKTAERSTHRDMSVAIAEWEEDLQFLIENRADWLTHSH